MHAISVLSCGHSKYRHSTKFPVWSPVKYAIFSYITDPVPDHKVHEKKMAPEDRSGRDVTEELTQIVRECVRNEIALQRSGSNPSLLMRTRDLIRKPRGDKFHRPGHRSIVSRSILWLRVEDSQSADPRLWLRNAIMRSHTNTFSPPWSVPTLEGHEYFSTLCRKKTFNGLFSVVCRTLQKTCYNATTPTKAARQKVPQIYQIKIAKVNNSFSTN